MRPIASRTEIIVETPVTHTPSDAGLLDTVGPSLSTEALTPALPSNKTWRVALGAIIAMVMIAFAWHTPSDDLDEPSEISLAIPHNPDTTTLPKTLLPLEQSAGILPTAPERLPATETYLPMRSLAPIRPFSLEKPGDSKEKERPIRRKEVLKTPALITVVTRPTGDIQIDGVSYGDMGVYNLELSPGNHIIRAFREGSPDQKKRIRLKAGRSYQMRFDMEKEDISFKETR